MLLERILRYLLTTLSLANYEILNTYKYKYRTCMKVEYYDQEQMCLRPTQIWS